MRPPLAHCAHSHTRGPREDRALLISRDERGGSRRRRFDGLYTTGNATAPVNGAIYP